VIREPNRTGSAHATRGSFAAMRDLDSAASLEAEGFAGFLTFGQLHRSDCLEVPDEPGVYVVLARGEAPHGFLLRSTAPVWRRHDPTLPTEALLERWVEGTELLYAGVAPGPGVRSRLRQRTKRFLRFGHGKVVAHWSGHAIWQLKESSRLLLAWRACASAEEAASLGTELLAGFERRHGSPPFANLRGETAGAEAEGGAEAD
jgi:hypothetical protein